MKIVHLLAGAGPMYCGSCIHGNTLVAALRTAGADVLLAPVYTPLRTDEESVSIERLGLGGINVYLDELLPFWRWMPALVRRQLDRPWLVSWAARHGGSTRPQQLGRLAVAMFRGEDGPLQNDIQPLIEWLRTEVRPDVVHLSNVMLAGLARPLRERLHAPVIATLSGEDVFLEKLPAPYYAQARTELRARAADLDGLVALSGYFADFMAEYLAVPRQRIVVIRPGLNLDGFATEGGRTEVRGQRSEVGLISDLRPLTSRAGGEGVPRPKTVGFFGRICPDKGLHLLVDAWQAMREAGNVPPCRLRAAGYLDHPDHAYLAGIRKQVAALGVADRFEYVGELDRPGKIAFLESLDVLCLPSVIRESKGLSALEAWAAGVPVVLPGHGAFPELVADTGGGLLYDPLRPEALAEALGRMLRDEAFAAECGRLARQAIHERYTSQREAAEILAFYEKLAYNRAL